MRSVANNHGKGNLLAAPTILALAQRQIVRSMKAKAWLTNQKDTRTQGAQSFTFDAMPQARSLTMKHKYPCDDFSS